MALARTHAIALVGVQGHVVEIEVDIENGLVALLLVGLPDTALREARDRIRSAIVNSQQSWPQRRDRSVRPIWSTPCLSENWGSTVDCARSPACSRRSPRLRPPGLAGWWF